MTIPRPEHPRPQFVRDEWLNLNGEWEFEIDAGDTGAERGLIERALRGRITVPFCPESKLSGVEHLDRTLAVWYRRTVRIPAAWAGKRALLHFGASDYDTTVWVNGREVGRHRGGFTPFSCDLHGLAAPGDEIAITVRARDDWRQAQPRGKQVPHYANSGCHYPRTTGIWQTVWLEAVPTCALKRPRITPDLANGCFRIAQALTRVAPGMQLRATLSDAQGAVIGQTIAADRDFCPQLTLAIPPLRRRLWSLDDPFLYDLVLELLDAQGAVVDRATSYAGLRAVGIAGMAVTLNGAPVFQRLVLDQGFYPEGLWTAPSDADLVRDIELSKAAGFNGARLHQKVFEERFLYHADRLGYLCWGEFGDWSMGTRENGDQHNWHATMITQWLEAIERDYNHPSLVGWCAMNESMVPIQDHIVAHDDVMRGMFLATKALDQTRPVLDVSGYCHRVAESDIYDSHDYEQDPAKFRATHAGTRDGRPFVNSWGSNPWGGADKPISLPWRGQPYFVSEFGGIWWNPDCKPGDASWGYGSRPKDEAEFYARFQGLCDVLLDDPGMFGYCYTQLTDVFQEQNGVVRFDRSTKLDLERLRAIQARPAAIERTGAGGAVGAAAAHSSNAGRGAAG